MKTRKKTITKRIMWWKPLRKQGYRRLLRTIPEKTLTPMSSDNPENDKGKGEEKEELVAYKAMVSETSEDDPRDDSEDESEN